MASRPRRCCRTTARSTAPRATTSASGMWCENVPDLTGRVPEQPTKDEAEAALRLIRETFKTFCFADAETFDDCQWCRRRRHQQALRGETKFAFLVALVDGCLSAEPALGARRVAAGGSNVGGRRREGSARPLHLHHRLWARSACRDRRRHSGRTGETDCRRADGGQPGPVPRQSQQHRFSGPTSLRAQSRNARRVSGCLANHRWCR